MICISPFPARIVESPQTVVVRLDWSFLKDTHQGFRKTATILICSYSLEGGRGSDTSSDHFGTSVLQIQVLLDSETAVEHNWQSTMTSCM